MSQHPRNPGPFFHSGGPVGVLLIHGFTGTAHIFESMSAELAAQGYTVSAPLLSGHGTTAEDMEATTAEDWYLSGEAAYDRLAETCSRIFVVGASLGGLVACRLARKRKVEGIVLLGPPIVLEREWLIRLGTVLFPLVRKRFYEKGKTRFGIRYYEQVSARNQEQKEILGGDNYSYRKIPIASIKELLKFIREVRQNDIPALTTPALLIQSESDGLVSPRSGNILFKSLPTPQKELLWIHEPHHRLHKGSKRDEVYPLIEAFIRRTVS